MKSGCLTMPVIDWFGKVLLTFGAKHTEVFCSLFRYSGLFVSMKQIRVHPYDWKINVIEVKASILILLSSYD